MTTNHNILIYTFIFMISFSLGGIISAVSYHYINTNYCIDRSSMYNANTNIYIKRNTVTNGLYWPTSDFYCVWVRDRDISEIQRTEYHEHCHYLVDEDFEHFCLKPYKLTECS
jgi:hypothetical protein